MVIAPPTDGAVVVMVNPAVVPVARPAPNVTVQVSLAPDNEGRLPQFTLVRPDPAVNAVATTPAGN